MTLAQFRRRRHLAIMAMRSDAIDRAADDRDAAIRAAWVDYHASVKAAEARHDQIAAAIDRGDLDHESDHA